MSYEQLMQHATDIQTKATKWAVVFSKRGLGDSAPPPYNSVDPAAYPEIAAEFADIPGLFQPFSDLPDPASYDSMISDLEQVVSGLSWGPDLKDPISSKIYPANLTLDKMTGAKGYLQDWTGDAAMTFVKTFLDPLKGAMEAARGVWATTRNDIDQIAHKTDTALDKMDDCGKNTWGISFTVLACVAGVLASVPTGGTGGLLVISAVGTAAWVEAANPPASAPKVDYSGESPQAVIGHLREAVAKLKTSVEEQEKRIADALTSANGVVTGNPTLFVAPRPDLASATAGNIMSPQEMGYSL